MRPRPRVDVFRVELVGPPAQQWFRVQASYERADAMDQDRGSALDPPPTPAPDEKQ